MSIFKKIQSDVRLKNNLKAAKETPPNEQVDNNSFPGPDGEYNFKFVKMEEFNSKDIDYTVLTFAVQDEDCRGAKMTKMFGWTDNDYGTIEDVQVQFFETLQFCGVNTPELSLEEIEKATKEALHSAIIKGAVKTSKKTGNKYLRFIEFVGNEGDEPAEEEENEWSKEESEEAEVETTSEEVEEVEEGEEDPEYLPSECVGYNCIYEGETYTIVSADDESWTVTFTDVGAPEDEVYEAVPLEDVTFEE